MVQLRDFEIAALTTCDVEVEDQGADVENQECLFETRHGILRQLLLAVRTLPHEVMMTVFAVRSCRTTPVA
eukprot:8261232-Prorocentrum_lima.AAC.1